jgi:plastocyanin
MKKNLFFGLTFMLFMGYSNAAIHKVLVGQGGSYTFSPSTLNVVVGDVVRFQWVSDNHTTTSLTIPSGAVSWDSPMTANVTVFEYTVTTEGTYLYECNPHSGGMTGSFTARANTSTGVAKSNLFTSENVILSPNPASSNTNLTIAINQNFKGDIKIFSAQGILISEFDIQLTGEVTIITLSVDKLSSGMYYINISDKQDALFVTKLVVEN